MTDSSSFILAADVGGTKANVALFDPALPGGLSARVVRRASYPSGAYADFGDLIEEFLAANGAARTPIAAACFGLPGPVIDGVCETSNLPWKQVSALELGRRFSIPKVSLLNDLEATAHALSALDDSELSRLSRASHAEPGRARAVVAAGTGLGMAILAPERNGFRPLASEGGHVEFAPQTELEIELLRFLQRDLEHVSIERIVSGPGLVRVYEFFATRSGARPNAELVRRVGADAGEAPARITRAALEAECEAASAALELFIHLYGAVAGNLSLTAYATGGLYLAGGIAPKILRKLQEGAFMTAFNAKGRLSSVTQRVPVYVVLNEHAPLLGAANYALSSLG